MLLVPSNFSKSYSDINSYITSSRIGTIMCIGLLLYFLIFKIFLTSPLLSFRNFLNNFQVFHSLIPFLFFLLRQFIQNSCISFLPFSITSKKLFSVVEHFSGAFSYPALDNSFARNEFAENKVMIFFRVE